MVYVLVALLFFVLVFLGFGLYAFHTGATRRDRTELFRASTVAPSARIQYKERVQAGVDWFESQDLQEVGITSRDGLKLKGELLEAPSPIGTVVAFHGFRSWPSREFGFIAKFLYDSGYTVLYPYQRAHRKSEGKYISFGVFERLDCQDWAEFMAARFPGLPLFLYGQSMGGATVIMASGLPLPLEVKGVIADCAYNSPSDVIENALKNSYKVPVYPLIWFMSFWALALARYGLWKTNTFKAMAKTRLPFLFIHGTADDLVPYPMGKANYDFCPTEKTMLTVEGAGHCACFYADEKRYTEYLGSFLKAHRA